MLRKKGKPSTRQTEGNRRDPAAIVIQCMARRYLAKARMKAVSSYVWLRVFDPQFKKYFWYNNMSGESSWKTPMFLTNFTEEDTKATISIQRLVRGFIGRAKARKIANQHYTRYYDAKFNKFYWLNKKTGETTWQVSSWLYQQQIEMPPEDQLLYNSQLKILELEEMLKEKEKEIQEVRLKRYEELEPEVIKDKVQSVMSIQLSKHMDEWRMEELAAWFTKLKMEEYLPFIYENRMDGNLFINLRDEEWADMGITSRVHIRKLQIILKPYRIRYQRRKDQIEDDEENELISEYSPSELSALIEAENRRNDDFSESTGNSDDSSYYSEEEEDVTIEITEEQKLQMKLDDQNITIHLLVKGDAINFPLIGDIVRVRYTATIRDSGKVVMSTKNILERPWVEFVLGIDQVIKGFDRALPKMSVGERSKITFSPEYGYGKVGLPPHIPPDTFLCFDLTLLGFRPRSIWVRPLIQDHNTHEKPYHEDLKISHELANNRSFASSMVDGDSIGSPQAMPSTLGLLGGSTTTLGRVSINAP